MNKLISLGTIWLLSLGVFGLHSTSTYAQGDRVGGGGDASEERVNEIRADILKWINNGGGRGLTFRPGIDQATYEIKMKEVLKPLHVIIGFTPNELEVSVDGVPKTCEGSETAEKRLKILCNIARFESTPEAKQYRLIHHEYAGLSGVEQNDGAASDYFFSSQITDFLKVEKVLRLAVSKRKDEKLDLLDLEGDYTLISGTANCPSIIQMESYESDEDYSVRVLQVLSAGGYKTIKMGRHVYEQKHHQNQYTSDYRDRYNLTRQVTDTRRAALNSFTVKTSTVYGNKFIINWSVSTMKEVETFTLNDNVLNYLFKLEENGTKRSAACSFKLSSTNKR